MDCLKWKGKLKNKKAREQLVHGLLAEKEELSFFHFYEQIKGLKDTLNITDTELVPF